MSSKLHYTPFEKGFPHFSMKRDDFLKGKLRTYFGPGHKPNMIATLFQPSSSDETYNDDRYAAPSDWPKSGSVLRAPQIVWIDISVMDAHKHYAPERPDDPFYYISLISGIPACVAADNDQKALVASALEAKTAIEKIRPNRTWVSVTNHVDHYDGPIEFSYYTGDGSWQDCGSCPIMAPSNRNPWFGTDFLEIWLGDAVYSGLQLFEDNITLSTVYEIPDQVPFMLTPEQIAADPIAMVPKHRLLDNHSKFYRYATRLFDHGLADIEGSPADVTSFFPTTSTVFDEYVSWANTHAIDITHPGNTMSVSSDSLVELIANHYGFDADTGKDK